MQAKKSLGQNFLTDPTVLARILEYAQIQPTDTIVEIGAGTGILTRELAKRASRVIAFEVDDDLIPGLLKQFPTDTSSVQIVHEDILRADLGIALHCHSREGGNPGSTSPSHTSMRIPDPRVKPEDDTLEDSLKKYRVIANIPYYITAPIIQHLLRATPQPQDIILMVQKEVAERIAAPAGKLSILGVSVQAVADTEYLFTVPKSAFDPVPKVDSALLRITPRTQTIAPSPLFFRLVKIGFAAKRKTIANTLSAGLALSKEEVSTLLTQSGISPDARPQTITVQEWHQLEATVSAQYATKIP
jgi:16S rRNA (adenine1518-N6/adenine1519-N6)-dimethyltransferase